MDEITEKEVPQEAVSQESTQENVQENVQADPTKDIKVGYYVALKKDGEISFEILGNEVGIIELMGLHEMAGLRLHEPLETAKLQQVNQALTLILQLLQNRKSTIGQNSIVLPK